jgi:hypothetical protein
MQIGCFVYQYSKLRMLEFYYDFMDVFVDRRDFQYCAMDTDSAYMALSATSLEEVIKPAEHACTSPLSPLLVFLLTPLQLNLSSAPKQK